MIVQNLIERYEELEDLELVYISYRNNRREVYEGEDIDFIDNRILGLTVTDYYTYEVDNDEGKRVRVLDIEVSFI